MNIISQLYDFVETAKENINKKIKESIIFIRENRDKEDKLNEVQEHYIIISRLKSNDLAFVESFEKLIKNAIGK